MDKVTKVKKRLKAGQWKTLIAECQSGGMTVKSWCGLDHICIATYYRNLHKSRLEVCDNPPEVCDNPPEVCDNPPTIPEEKPVAFEPLKVDVRNSSRWIPLNRHSFFFVAGVVTESRHTFGKAMALFFSTNARRMENTSGHVQKMN